METEIQKILKLEQNEMQTELKLGKAKELILSGHIVAFPTETVYGLGANALDQAAVEKIFIAKNRPQDNPLIIHVSSRKMLLDLIKPNKLPEIYETILDSFWPGPLTILVKKPAHIPDCVSAGQDTIAVRMPAHPIAKMLIEMCNVPLAAPSANTSGRPSPTIAMHVYDDLNGRIPLVIDGGPCHSGVESTVLDGLRIPPVILRPGGVTVAALEAVIGGKVAVYKRDFEDKSMEQAPTTPGMKYRHYTPNCAVSLVEADRDDKQKQLHLIEEQYQALCKVHSKVGVLLINPSNPHLYPIQASLGINAKQVAQSLFSKLREMEAAGVSVILIQGIGEDDEGMAIMNRLRKAATEILYC